MNPKKPHFIEMLEHGSSQVLCVYGTSLSYHLTPHLRDALVGRYGERIKVINASISGKASRSGLENLQNRVISHSPDALMVEFAVNDAHTYFHDPQGIDAGITLSESRTNLEAILDMIQVTLPACELILQTTNPAWDPEGNQDKAMTRRPDLESFYEQYRAVAKARGLQLIDNHSIWAEIQSGDTDRFERLIPDGVHPTPEAIKAVLVPHILAQWAIS
ncbi:MAG: SGNH/GDSL hydrolase family protein [Cytophagaceae bacterium]|nr:MAG: SGNH/GDSL hydrolase family protein [Cytophagaceae bacterium]